MHAENGRRRKGGGGGWDPPRGEFLWDPMVRRDGDFRTRKGYRGKGRREILHINRDLGDVRTF